MTVLVAYASRHGATRGIAERIGARLTADGAPAEVVHVKDVRDPARYDACIVGSAAYVGRWLGEASSFVRKNRAVLRTRPVWLFSSGPVGPDVPDAQGREPRVASIPKEAGEFVETIGAREHHVFFGAWDRGQKPKGLAERLVLAMPATKNLMPDGDFRDWDEIDAWADGIARSLKPDPEGRA